MEKPKKEVPTTDFIKEDVRGYNVGESDYATHKIQPWDIWIEYKLNPFDADIVKRVLRTKERVPKSFIDKLRKLFSSSTALDEWLKTDAVESRKQDYEKIIHICKERIRQIDSGEDKWKE